mmetsp:Transcript_40224/g.84481  ORF Transcript_40224/g.84481 Transcript_40224/m.84481 type:complete len:104 (+) Transcript_40224:156-467(+)
MWEDGCECGGDERSEFGTVDDGWCWYESSAGSGCAWWWGQRGEEEGGDSYRWRANENVLGGINFLCCSMWIQCLVVQDNVEWDVIIVGVWNNLYILFEKVNGV